MKLLIASNNEHKIAEIKSILAEKFEEIVSLKEIGVDCDPEECGATFEENALIKAKAVAKFTQMAVLADDTGLCVDALGGLPGVFSARFAANEANKYGHDNAANRRKLLRELEGVTNRSAHFESAVALLYPNGKTVVAAGKVEGRILKKEEGENGFGYDSLFFCNELGKTFAQATAAEKNRVSHRGKALQNLLAQL